jgi:hypothetical protein
MNRSPQIGFTQRIQLDWLEKTADLFRAGNSREQIRAALNEYLQDKLSIGSTTKSSNRKNAITILLRIWVSPPQHLEPLRDEGLEHLQRLPLENHLVVHWGMAMAVYPFLGSVAETVGRLLKLQGSFTISQVQRRIREQLGERETVSRAARRILRCFVDWDVLQDTESKGVYQSASTQLIGDARLSCWLLEAALLSINADSKALKAVAQSPALFPFVLNASNPLEFKSNPRLALFRQGLDEDVLVLQSR